MNGKFINNTFEVGLSVWWHAMQEWGVAKRKKDLAFHWILVCNSEHSCHEVCLAEVTRQWTQALRNPNMKDIEKRRNHTRYLVKASTLPCSTYSRWTAGSPGGFGGLHLESTRIPQKLSYNYWIFLNPPGVHWRPSGLQLGSTWTSL